MKIAIVAMGELGSIGLGVGPAVERYVRELLGCQTELGPRVDIPAGSFDARRNQFSSPAFMLALARAGVGDADRVIGLTACDLFIPMLTFVFGQAQLGGRVALVSLARLRPEFYGAEPDPELLRLRLAKEIGHELGHSLGLIHCPERGCLMSLATGIQDVDQKNREFCRSCRQLLPQQKVVQEVRNESEMADSGRR